jgi:hypothetical protein
VSHNETLMLQPKVAFIEMARAMLPLVTLLALWVSAVEVPTREHIHAVSLTGLGCAAAAYGEASAVLRGGPHSAHDQRRNELAKASLLAPVLRISKCTVL